MFFFSPCSLMLAGRNIMIIFSQKILPISLISNYLLWLNSGRNSNRRVKLQKWIQTKTLMRASLKVLPCPAPFLGCCMLFSVVRSKHSWRAIFDLRHLLVWETAPCWRWFFLIDSWLPSTERKCHAVSLESKPVVWELWQVDGSSCF